MKLSESGRLPSHNDISGSLSYDPLNLVDGFDLDEAVAHLEHLYSELILLSDFKYGYILIV